MYFQDVVFKLYCRLKRTILAQAIPVMAVCSFLSWTAPVAAQEKERIVAVTYISSENIYLDGGKDAGINVGDTLALWHDRQKIAEVQVIYSAEHTASAKILTIIKNPQIGDQAELRKSMARSTLVQPPAPVTQPHPPATLTAEPPAASAVRISGSIGLQLYQFWDRSGFKHDFSQPVLRLNFKAQNLWNRAYNLRFHLRSNYNRKAQNYSSIPGQREWRNRIYEMSFSYDNPRAPVNFRAGRIISNTFSGVGYIDGALLQYNFADSYHLGIFAGTQPQWQYSDFQIVRQKYGLYTNYRKGESVAGSRLEATLALVGEYHYQTISREYVYLQSSYAPGQYFSFYQNAEIEVNRYWRQEKTGKSIDVSSLLLSGNFYITGNLSSSLSYDHYHNYYTYELRSMADSLFDSAARQGLRSTIYWRIIPNLRFTASAGFRWRENDSGSTYSWSGQLTNSNLVFRGSMISARLAGYSNLYTRGYNPSLLVGQNFNRGHSVNVEYGHYFYNLDINGTYHVNHWLRSTLQFVLPWHLYLYGQYEYDWGTDRQGQIFSAELGYHF
jgi:hypothetical protein